jgi:predicted lipoprotein
MTCPGPLRVLALALPLLCLLTAPLSAEERGEAFLEASLEQVILPGYESLLDAAKAATAATGALCAAPNETALAEARGAFAGLTLAFSRVELYRFGPAREDYRLERLFFWPDRRGRGLKQVQGILAEEEASALTVESLRQKSVAVQGLLALEYLLHGSGSEALAGGAAFRCGYAAATAGAVEATAQELLAAWQAPDGMARILTEPSPDNPLFKNREEALQELFQAAREQLEILRDHKLGPALGESFEAANEKRAPFWRSGLALPAMIANIEGVAALLPEASLAPLLPEEDRHAASSLRFELRQAREALEGQAERPLAEALSDEAAYQGLAYARFPLGGAMDILGETLPEALGLTMGFNSLDGD